MLLFYYFNFERKYDVLKSKTPYFLLKNERRSKMENPTHTFRVEAHERKKRAFFIPFILSEGNFLTFVFYFN